MIDAQAAATDIDALFTLPPEQFTASRNALVRELRTAGHRDLAAHVKTLRRPTVAAWAVNRAVRSHAEVFASLLDAGAAVRAAQRRALSGMRRSGMRDATRARRTLIEQLTDMAADILNEYGVDAASHRDDISATFDAASADDDAAETVGAARLSKPLRVPATFAALEGLTVLAPVDDPADDLDTSATSADAGSGHLSDTGAAAESASTDPADEARQRDALARRAAIRTVSDARRELTEAQAVADRAAAEAQRSTDRANAAEQTAATAEERARRLRAEATELAARADRARARADETRHAAARLAAKLAEHETELHDLG